MKRFLSFMLIFIVFAMCGKGPESVKLEKGTKAYNLAMDITALLPEMNPDLNYGIVFTDPFIVTTGEIAQVISHSPEDYIKKLLVFPRRKIKSIVEGMAKDLGDKKLLIIEAQKNKITVSQAEVDSVLEKIYKNYGGEIKFKMNLRENNINRKYFYEDVKNSLLADKYLESVIGSKLAVSEKDVKAQFLRDTTVTLRHIMVSLDVGENAKGVAYKRRMIDTIHELALKGIDFATLAKKYSEDANTKENGGLIEGLRRGDTEAAFDSAAFATPEGEISGIVRTSYGFHVIKVISKKTGQGDFDEQKSKIRESLYQRSWDEYREQILDSLKNVYHYRFVSIGG